MTMPMATSDVRIGNIGGTVDVSALPPYVYAVGEFYWNPTHSWFSVPHMNLGPVPTENMAAELPSLDRLRSFVEAARMRFVREMAYGLLESAVHSYENGDWEQLGQAIVEWASTLEIEADPALMRRLHRRRATT